MATEYISELGDKLSKNSAAESLPKHIKVISAPNYRRVDNGVVTNPSIQDAIDGISPKVKYKKTTVQHTITSDEATQEKCQFSDPIVMPSDYGNKTVAILNLYGTIMTTDTSAVPNAFMIWIDLDSAHSSGSQVLSTNFITTEDSQVNFSASAQVPLSIGVMHPSGLYLDIWRHGLPANTTVSVTAEVTVLDRE